MDVLEHEHPLHLIDLQPNYPNLEEEYDDDDDNDDNDDNLIKREDFRSRQCDRCKQEINWFHRYYFECNHSCNYSLHKFCGELPITYKYTSHPHTLTLVHALSNSQYYCVLCGTNDEGGLRYDCSECDFKNHVNCVMASSIDRLIYHPSHPHPLATMLNLSLCECKACGRRHEGIFHLCTTCFRFSINVECAFLPKKLMIQETTKNVFSHTHPLTISYSFLKRYQRAKFNPRCRVCNEFFPNDLLWIYKCEKCRYYTHLDCATSREEPFMSIISSFGNRKFIKDFKDSDYPDLINLPFPEDSDSTLKHIFSKQVGCETSKMEDRNMKYNCHQHPLILIHVEYSDITKPNSSKSNTLSCHNPMKKIELLCNGCLRPITRVPFYKCADENENCNFVLHEWCTRLPAKVENHPDHKQHTLIFHPNAPNKFFSLFQCQICNLWCNGFVYSCLLCNYHIDVKCAFIPEKITHEAHPGHLLSRVQNKTHPNICRLCLYGCYGDPFSFFCHTCNIFIHLTCALLLPRQIRHKYDKHPMSLTYFPVENHKSEYFCEICEVSFDPEDCFYHCYDGCAQSLHSQCAPLILQSERAEVYNSGIYYYVNIKFGGSYNLKGHPHYLSFVQGINSDGRCTKCGYILESEMIFKCQQCEFVIDLDCCKSLSKS